MADQTLKNHQVVADRRTIGQWISDCFRSPMFRGCFYLFCAFIILTIPIATPLVFIALVPAIATNRDPGLPLRLPVEAKMRDKGDPAPGGDGFHMARGVVYLGNEQGSNKEAWVSWNDQRLHDYLMAATGGGKTELILAILANYELCGSGALLGDGKGTMLLPKQTTTIARLAGSDDDSFVISFLSGYKADFGRSHNKKSNNINPFGEGNDSTVKELLTSLMSDGGGDNQIFSDGASSLAASLAPAWVEGRDKGLFELNIDFIGSTLPLAKLFEFSRTPELSVLTKQYMTSYLDNLGYVFEKPAHEQPENVTRMHGYYVNYFMRVVTSFAISYRHIYYCQQGEVNMRDTVKSRRSLTFTLPPLEKSPDEVQNLGKTMLVAARSASSYGLGTTMEGTREETVNNLPAAHPIPYKFAFDEFSFYVLEGFSLMPAQLRGINISCLTGSQDYAGTKRAGEIDAESIFSNARTKYFGALEDSSTWEKVREIVGEVDMAVYDKLMNVGTMVGRYVPDLDLRLTRRCPLSISELQSQVEGQFHIMQRGKVRKIKTYYPNVSEDTVVDNYHLIRLVKSLGPSQACLNKLRVMQDFLAILSSTDFTLTPAGLLTECIGKASDNDSSDQAALNGLARYYQKTRFSIDVHTGELNEPQSTASSATSQESSQESPKEEEATKQPKAPDSEEIPSYGAEQSENLQQREEAEIDDFFNNVFDGIPPDIEDDLLLQTQREVELHYASNPPKNGVFGLTDTECNAIQSRLENLGLLLGESKEDAIKTSAQIVMDMRKNVFYLIPPKPNSDSDIKAKAAMLIQQADLFEV